MPWRKINLRLSEQLERTASSSACAKRARLNRQFLEYVAEALTDEHEVGEQRG